MRAASAFSVGLVFALLLEQAGPAHDDRQRVVELVGDAGEQAPHGGELLALAQGLALALDLPLGVVALGDVGDRRGVEDRAAGRGAPQHHLHRELAAVGAQRMHRQPLAEHPALAAVLQAPHAGVVRGAKALRDHHLADRPAEHLGAAPAEHRLRRRIELDDVAGGVGRDQRGEGVIEDRRLERLAAMQLRHAFGELELARLQLGVVAAEHRHQLDLAALAPVGNEGLGHVAAAALRKRHPAFEPDGLAAPDPLDDRPVAGVGRLADDLAHPPADQRLGAPAEELEHLAVGVDVALLAIDQRQARGDVVEQHRAEPRVEGRRRRVGPARVPERGDPARLVHQAASVSGRRRARTRSRRCARS